MNCPASSDQQSDRPLRPGSPPRRTFISLLSGLLGLVLVVIPSAIGGLFFADPLLRRKQGSPSARRDAEGFVKLDLPPEAIPEDGTPVAAKVVDDRIDAWNRYPAQEIGTVWLRKTEQGRIIALNATCPHLGCLVDYRGAQRDFFCPCHTSAFTLDGQPKNTIPPRPMDPQEVRVESSAIWVKFQNYRAGTPERIPV